MRFDTMEQWFKYLEEQFVEQQKVEASSATPVKTEEKPKPATNVYTKSDDKTVTETVTPQKIVTDAVTPSKQEGYMPPPPLKPVEPQQTPNIQQLTPIPYQPYDAPKSGGIPPHAVEATGEPRPAPPKTDLSGDVNSKDNEAISAKITEIDETEEESVHIQTEPGILRRPESTQHTEGDTPYDIPIPLIEKYMPWIHTDEEKVIAKPTVVPPQTEAKAPIEEILHKELDADKAAVSVEAINKTVVEPLPVSELVVSTVENSVLADNVVEIIVDAETGQYELFKIDPDPHLLRKLQLKRGMRAPRPRWRYTAEKSEGGSETSWHSMYDYLAFLTNIHGYEAHLKENNKKRPRKHENRGELLERIMNPTLTLEETAVLLGVCPTTVRRYTDKEWLAHHRTTGNQRRFKLADIIKFLEEHGELINQP